MLCGIIAPTSGEGTVAGFDIARQSEQIKQRIGYMSQKFSLYDDLTVNENIAFYGGVYDVPRRRLEERRRWILEMANLTTRADSLTRELAVGWKQRLALGCAVVHEPDILFLDEPTAGVDPISRRNFWDLIYTVAGQGVTVFVTTHYMDEAEHCDRIGLIYGGKLIALAGPTELKQRYVAGRLLEVQAEPLMTSLEILVAEPAAQDVAIFGAALHVLVQDEAGEGAGAGDVSESGGEGGARGGDCAFVGGCVCGADRRRRGEEARRRRGVTAFHLATMLLRTYMITWKEFVQIFRDPRTLAIVVVLPVLMLVLYGYAINLDVDHIRLGVWDQNRSQESRELIGDFTHGRYFTLASYLHSNREVTEGLDRGRARVVLVIPTTYARDLASGRTARVQIIVDGSDSTTSSTALGYIDAIVQQQSLNVAVQALRQTGMVVQAAAPIEARFRYWFNSELRSTNFIVPGLVAVILMMLAALLTSMTVVRERERGTIEALIVSPVRPGS